MEDVAFYEVEIEVEIEVDAKAEGSIHLLRVSENGKSKEMVMWDIKEWTEDPTLVFNIADGGRRG